MSATTSNIDDVPVLTLDGVTAGYGRTTVLRDVTMSIAQSQVVALLGPNGAGKTTLLRTVAGLLRPSEGTIHLDGRNIERRSPAQRARDGLCLVPEGRGVFPNLTVRENLWLQAAKNQRKATTDRALDAFPALRDRLTERAGNMSGGQQQMLALARCFARSPRLVLLDEVSMGLAPRIIDEIFDALEILARSGTSLVLVEQYVSRALAIADHVFILDRGSLSFSGSPADITESEIMNRYLSVEV